MWVYPGQWYAGEDLLERFWGKYSLCIKRREAHWNSLFLTWKMMEKNHVRTWCLDLRQPFCYPEGKANRTADNLTYHPDLRKLMNHFQNHLTPDFLLLQQYASLGFKPLLIGFLNICSLMHANWCRVEISKHMPSFPFLSFNVLEGSSILY